MAPNAGAASRRSLWLGLLLGGIVFFGLVGLGTWQVQRLQWKEALIARIAERIGAAPLTLAEVEAGFKSAADVDYTPVTATGTFLHGGERHFLATWRGQAGFFVYTPLELDDGRIVFVNRGFVPYRLKDQATRPDGLVAGPVVVTGLARNPLTEKPSSMLPDNDPEKNVFYWKDRDGMAGTAGLPAGAGIVPVFVDANDAPNPGGWPAGGVTMISMPNSHLQYAVTWYGLAAALAGVMCVLLWRRRQDR